MFVVTSATGGLGSAVVEHLLGLTSPSRVAVCVRRPERARPLAARGVDVRYGDFDVPESLDRAFADAERLLIISASGIDFEHRVACHRAALASAVRAGVGHVYYTSLAIDPGSVASVMQAHVATEELLKDAGIRFTILRNGVYVEAWSAYLGDVTMGEVVIPADGPIAWVARSDLAAGTARLMVEGGRAGETLLLTGPVALDISAATEVAGRIVGRPLARRIVSLDEYIARQVAAGKAETFARAWATTYLGMAHGDFAKVDPCLGNLLGRPLRTFEDALRECLV